MTWKVKIGNTEHDAADAATLQRWISEGRVKPEHYVYNPTLARWQYAREVGELEAAFTALKPKPQSGCLLSFALAMVGLMLVFWSVNFESTLIMLFGMAFIVFSVLALVIVLAKRVA